MRPYFLYLIFLVPTILTAQLELVTDYNTGEEDGFDCFGCRSQPTAKIGTGILTVASSAEHGKELCLLKDGVFSLLKDINPGMEDARIDLLTQREDGVYFVAKDPVNGSAIWRTDGTGAGTELFFDPDTEDAAANITDFTFGRDTTLYVVLQSTLYRFKDGMAKELATSVFLSTANDNFPGGSFTPYQAGVAYVSDRDAGFGGGLYYATDTVRQLATIENQDRFDQAFGLREVNGNLLFSLDAIRDNRTGTYQYESVADTLKRFTLENGDGLFATRWYEMTDSLALGLVDNKDYYVFDGINSPSIFYAASRLTPVAREIPASIRKDSVFIWQTDGGVFEDEKLVVTDGTQAGTSVLLEGRLGNISNLIAAGNYIFFITENGSFRPKPFYRYDLTTGELVNFFEAPRRSDGFSYEVQLLAVQDSQLYFTSDIDPDLGRELYRVYPGVDIVSIFQPRQLPQLSVQFTSETFTVEADRAGQASLTIFDLDGRLLAQERIPVNTQQILPTFRGMRIFFFEYDGKVAVRRVVGGRH